MIIQALLQIKRKEAMALQIYQYYPCRELDWMLLNWMTRMERDEELNKTISVGNGTPSMFLQFFQNRRLYFTADDFGNLTRACWIEACMDSVFIGYYIHPDARRDEKNKVFFLYDILDEIFKLGVPVVVGFIQERPSTKETKQFVFLHERLGYTYRGFVPKFFNGEDCHIVAMTEDDWAKGNEWKRRWEQERKPGG